MSTLKEYCRKLSTAQLLFALQDYEQHDDPLCAEFASQIREILAERNAEYTEKDL